MLTLLWFGSGLSGPPKGTVWIVLILNVVLLGNDGAFMEEGLKKGDFKSWEAFLQKGHRISVSLPLNSYLAS